MTDVPDSFVATALFAIVAALVGADLLSDAGSDVGGLHLLAEALGTTVASLGAVAFARRYLAERAEVAELRARAAHLLAPLGETIAEQFRTWKLTDAEAEIGTLLLKGLSLKEIATVRDTSERTSREQARAVYRKAGVAGRAELAAWFIEDLL